MIVNIHSIFKYEIVIFEQMIYSITPDFMICSIYWSYYDKQPWVSNSWTKNETNSRPLCQWQLIPPMFSTQGSIQWSNHRILSYGPTPWFHFSVPLYGLTHPPYGSTLKSWVSGFNRSVFISLLWFAKKDKGKSVKEVLFKDLFILYDKSESSVDEKDSRNINSKL